MPELAWVCFDFARALIKRNAIGDRSRAQKLLRDGVMAAESRGMKPLEEKLRCELRNLISRTDQHGLTPRELEIVDYVVRGFSNPEIGRMLGISQHTAATHIQHILRKTHTANRAELTAYAVRAGIVDY